MSNTNSVFEALADETRRRIIVMLSGNQMNVNEIAGNFSISRPAVSKHLRILKDSGLVKQAKDGREMLYSFNPQRLKVVYDWLKFYDKFWDKKLVALKAFAEKK